MKPFRYRRVTEIHQAIQTMHQHPGAAYLAGGTTLLDLMKLHLEMPEMLLDINALPLYACPHVAVTHRLVAVNEVHSQPMRGPGEGPGSFALESALDELAYVLNMDPLQLRLRNFAENDPHTGRPWSSNSLKECYRAGAEAFGWSRRNPTPRSMQEGHTLTGWGMATAAYPVFAMKASARAQLYTDGSVVVQSGTQDVGAGTSTVMTQVAAEALGLPLERVRFEWGDTHLPQAPSTAGSWATASVAPAVYSAATALREKVIGLACADRESPLYAVPPGEIEVKEGRLRLKSDPTRGETYQETLARQPYTELEARSKVEPTDNQYGHCIEVSGESVPSAAMQHYSMYSFGAVFAEVKVDMDLGQVRVSRVVGAYSSGRVLNSKTTRSQYIGGITFGIGMALLEDSHTDARFGRITNANLGDYLLPTHADVPNLEVVLVHEDDPHVNALGIKGIGMLGTVGAAAAIANAVYHATGIRVRDLPITPEKILCI